MILAEDLLLLTYDDESGAADPLIDALDQRLAGALLVELALAGRVEVTAGPETRPDGAMVKKGRVVVRDDSSTGHPALDEALRVIAVTPRKAQSLIEPLSRGLRARLLTGLAERGILQRETRKVLRIFPITLWPAADSTHEEALIQRLRSVLVDGATPTPSDAAIIALSKGPILVHRLIAKEDRKIATARAKEVAAGDWASDATKAAIDSAHASVAAITAAVAASTAAASSAAASC